MAAGLILSALLFSADEADGRHSGHYCQSWIYILASGDFGLEK